MRVEFLAQPDRRVGDLIHDCIESYGEPQELVMVSAFASLPTVLRLKPTVAGVRAAGSDVRLVLGVDLGGTSKEVLEEVASWDVSVTIVKNQLFGIIFHPKLYLLRWADKAEIIVGSNNLTDGGLYRNYEASCRTTYVLPADEALFKQALSELQRFLRPRGPTASLLTPAYLAALLALPEIPSEMAARRNRGEGTAKRPDQNRATPVFGLEKVPAAPRLPPDLQFLLLAARKGLQAEFKRAVSAANRKAVGGSPEAPLDHIPQKQQLPAQLDPSAFYMTLAASRGESHPTIPGEQRIPLEALEMAEDFWGWPDNYERQSSPRLGARAKQERVYWNWRPRWRIWSADNPTAVATRPVRMYFYENSSDFRFYSGDLVRMGAIAGDILQLRRVDDTDAVFECVLARQGTSAYANWLPLLINEVQAGRSYRSFGFA